VITRIELHNFMSHRRTVIEPSAGLTVLIGPNNCGKSALVAALQILCHNENSTYVKRHGEKECAVVVHTSEGHVIEWRRKTSPRYLINGVEHSRLGNSRVPDDLHSLLRLPLVADEDDDSFNVHFGSQKSPIFLLNSRAGTAAKFFASSSDAIRLLEMQQRHKEKVTEARRQHQQLEAEAAIVSDELEALEATVPLAERLQGLEGEFQRLGALEAEIESLIDFESELAYREQRVDVLSAVTDSLGLLKEPPLLAEEDPLQTQIERLERAAADSIRLSREADRPSGLSSPPTLADDAALDRLVFETENAAARLRRLEGHHEALAVLIPPPMMEDAIALQAMLRQLERVAKDAATSKARCEWLSGLTEPPQWDDTGSLERVVQRLEEQSLNLQTLKRHAHIAADLVPPPLIGADSALTMDLERLAASTGRVTELVHCLLELDAELSEAAARLREAAASETCPTCGQPFDADRLMELPAALGGHAHGAA
jgi:DNA repair exonuclease SbcCD ATPase subunit